MMFIALNTAIAANPSVTVVQKEEIGSGKTITIPPSLKATDFGTLDRPDGLLSDLLDLSNQLTDKGEDTTIDPEGPENALRHEAFITHTTANLLSLISLVIAIQFGQSAFQTTALVILIGFLYNHKYFPSFISRRLNGSRRLKDFWRTM